MRKPSVRRLKVFEARLGFYDSVVAAVSQGAALRAWGVHRNLFADGEARVAADKDAVAAALAHPEFPLKRAVGSGGAFEIEPAALPTVPDAPKPTGRPKPKAQVRPAKPAPPDADRGPLTKAEAAQRALDKARKREEADLARRQVELDAEKAAAQDAYVSARKSATALVAKAREAYRTAGGRD